MRVFVTGATGFIGSAVVRELVSAGHSVLGLARSDTAAASLAAMGAGVHYGSLDDLESLRRGASASDGVVHLAFIHDFSRYEENGETDRRAVEAFGDALAGTDRPLVITSGTAVLPAGQVRHEDDTPDPESVGKPRIASEKATLALAARGVRASVVRLPPSVHGEGDQAFVPALIGIARHKGVSAYVGDGANRWPAVHRLDAARLFRLALEKGSAGAILHGVADEGVPVRDIARVIGHHLNVPIVSKSPDEAAEHFGWLAGFLGMDCPASSARSRNQLEWQPVHPSLIADLEQGHYFAGRA